MSYEETIKRASEKIKDTEPTLPNCRCGGTPKMQYTGHDGWSIRCTSCWIKATNDPNMEFNYKGKEPLIDAQFMNVVAKWEKVMG